MDKAQILLRLGLLGEKVQYEDWMETKDGKVHSRRGSTNAFLSLQSFLVQSCF